MLHDKNTPRAQSGGFLESTSRAQSARFGCGAAVLVTLWLGMGGVAALAAPPRLPAVSPQRAGMNGETLGQIDAVVAEGIRSGQMPGCVVAIGRRGKLVLLKAYGDRLIEPQRVPMTTDTVFDLASLTKPVATATSVMLLVQQGKVKLDDPVARHLPEFGQNGKDRITVFQLLTHQGGLIADNSLRDYEDGIEKAWERIFALKPVAEPGTKFIYSDMGYIVLGELVRRVSGKDLNGFSREHIYGPLGMSETGFLPGETLRRRAAPTEKRNDGWMQGAVHDPRAYRLGGVAGHAGLFTTAEDLAVYAQMMLGGGQYRGVRVLQAETLDRMTTPHRTAGGLRGLGWDMRSGYSSNRAKSYSPRAFGHGGFTGTAMWIDPGYDLFVIFLSSRLYPDGKGAVNAIAGRIGSIAVAAIEDTDRPMPTARPKVLTGIDVLVRDRFRQLAGRRVGLITNHTGRSWRGVSTARLLAEAENVELVALFSPEHGLEGKLDVAQIADAQDPESQRPVYSLYGKTRKPTAEMLDGIDTLVFDIQDIGTRFYTYISTMGLAMEAAAEHKVRFVVLDRPNPIGGREVAGPVLDAGRESFTGFHRIPVRHGMTAGELATMFKAERKLELDLQVVRAEGWRREELFDAAGLTWIDPSPNMRSLTQALLYPGIGLLETTNLSVGRGTDTPFEVIGAPWLDGTLLARELNRVGLPGVRFVPIELTPEASVYAGRACGGVNIIVTDRAAFRPVRTGLEIAQQLFRLYPDTWSVERFDRLLCSAGTLDALRAGKTVAEIEAAWQPRLEEFLRRRGDHLLYR